MESSQHKTCTKCGLSKPLSEYANEPKSRDGKSWSCKACIKAYMLERAAKPKIVPEEKRCKRCLVVKPIDTFGLDKNTTDGHASRCMDCKREESASWNQNNVKKRRASTARWTANNPDKRQAYVEANKNKISQRRKERYAADPAKENAKNAANYLLKKDEWRPTRRAWDQAHPEFAHAKNKRRRAQQAGSSVNDLTHQQWLEVQEAQRHRCYYCRKRCKGKLTQDHLTPLSQGGTHTLHNVIAVCMSCNSKKGTKPPPVPVQPLLLTIAPTRKPKKKGA